MSKLDKWYLRLILRGILYCLVLLSFSLTFADSDVGLDTNAEQKPERDVKVGCIGRFFKSHLEDTQQFFTEFKQAPLTRGFIRAAKPAELENLDKILSNFRMHISNNPFRLPFDLTKLTLQTVRYPLWFVAPEYRLAGPTSLLYDWYVLYPLATAAIGPPLHFGFGYLKKKIATNAKIKAQRALQTDIDQDFRYSDIKDAENRGLITHAQALQKASDLTAAYNSYFAASQAANQKAPAEGVDIVAFSTVLAANPNMRPLFKSAEPFLTYHTSEQGFSLGVSSSLPKNYTKLHQSPDTNESVRLQKILDITNVEIYRLMRIPSWIKNPPPEGEKNEYDALMNDPYEQKLLQNNKAGKLSELDLQRLVSLVSKDAYNQAHLQIEETMGYGESDENWGKDSWQMVLEREREE